jgi:hypothetical protein
MPNLVPGARWEPISLAGVPRRRKGRGFCLHVAVSNAPALRPGSNATWHFYLPKQGQAIQYVDLDYVAYAQLEGNPTMVSAESQGGMVDADREPWTDNQCEWAARILAHLHKTEGTPLQVMPDSRAESKGLGYHRLGIDPWRVGAGERWSSSRGKLCPGAAKIAQVPSIVARATQLVNGTTEEDPLAALTESEQRELLEAARTIKKGGQLNTYLGEIPDRVARVLSERLDTIEARLNELAPPA